MTDLDAMLATLTVTRRPGTFTFVAVDRVPEGTTPHAMIREDEATTVVLEVPVARSLGLAIGFEAAWLTLDVHSALEAVGLTAVVSARLAEVMIPCNVIAGFHHDHLLVPAERSDDAVAALTGATGTPGSG